MSEDTFVLLSTIGVQLLMLIMGYIGGRLHQEDIDNDRQVRKDKAAAARLRASIRDYDSRTDQFVLPQAFPAQSIARRRCHRGPERCLCDDCTQHGVPPSP